MYIYVEKTLEAETKNLFQKPIPSCDRTQTYANTRTHTHTHTYKRQNASTGLQRNQDKNTVRSSLRENEAHKHKGIILLCCIGFNCFCCCFPYVYMLSPFVTHQLMNIPKYSNRTIKSYEPDKNPISTITN